MSRALSGARCHFEVANIRLEDLLLNELGVSSDKGDISSIIKELESSASLLGSLRQSARNLAINMSENNYQDLHKILGLSPSVVSHELAGRGLAPANSLLQVAEILDTRSFYGVIERLDGEASKLSDFTLKLRDAVARLQKAESDGQVNEVLEQNRPGNIKTEFAELYMHWNAFQDLFLASSMLSTELWYRFSNVGSLVTGPKLREATG